MGRWKKYDLVDGPETDKGKFVPLSPAWRQRSDVIVDPDTGGGSFARWHFQIMEDIVFLHDWAVNEAKSN